MAGLVREVSERHAWLPYAVPFAVFMLLTEPARYFPHLAPHLYVVKTVLTAVLLWVFRDFYRNDLSRSLTSKQSAEAVLFGLVVLALWIGAEDRLFQMKPGNIFDPYGLGNSRLAVLSLVGIRLLGSSLVVPVMEELFWRSMLMRWLIDPDFRKVPMGTFSWFSFTATAVLFGLEHNRILAGICAGIFYNLLLIRQKNLKGVILAHAVTNLGLGIYVVVTGNWHFW